MQGGGDPAGDPGSRTIAHSLVYFQSSVCAASLLCAPQRVLEAEENGDGFHDDDDFEIDTPKRKNRNRGKVRAGDVHSSHTLLQTLQTFMRLWFVFVFFRFVLSEQRIQSQADRSSERRGAGQTLRL